MQLKYKMSAILPMITHKSGRENSGLCFHTKMQILQKPDVLEKN